MCKLWEDKGRTSNFCKKWYWNVFILCMQKVHPRQTYSEVIESLIKEIKK